MNKLKVLFICSHNIHRSRTAETIFKDQFETKSAGVYNEKPVTEKQLAWADLIVVMEEEHRIELTKRFPDLAKKKRIIVLDIPDTYFYIEPALVKLLKEKMQPYLPK